MKNVQLAGLTVDSYDGAAMLCEYDVYVAFCGFCFQVIQEFVECDVLVWICQVEDLLDQWAAVSVSFSHL